MPVEESWLAGQGNQRGDQTETIEDDRTCHRCGYALRGLSALGRCPECGQPIGPKRAGRGSYIRFSERSPEMFGRVRRAAFFSIIAWAGGVTLWLGAYYLGLGGWMLAGPVVVSVCAIAVAFLITGRELEFVHSSRAQSSAFAQFFRSASIGAPVLTVVTIVVIDRLPGATGVIILFTLLTAWAWTLVQVLVCVGFAKVAGAAEDDGLSTHLIQMAKGLTFIVIFMSPFQAVMQWLSVRMASMPVFCLPCYMVVLGFLFGQVFFCLCMFRVARLMKWALVYQARSDNKSQRLRERVKESDHTPATTTRLERD